jgi:hypothetical protein
VSICCRINEEILPKAVSGSRRVWIFRCLYKRLEEVTKSTWLFFLSEVVSAQVLRRKSSNFHLLHFVPPRRATP